MQWMMRSPVRGIVLYCNSANVGPQGVLLVLASRGATIYEMTQKVKMVGS